MKLLLQILVTVAVVRLLFAWINKRIVNFLLRDINAHKETIDNVCAANGYSDNRVAYEQLSDWINAAKYTLQHMKFRDLSRAYRQEAKLDGPPLKTVVSTLCKDDPVATRLIMDQMYTIYGTAFMKVILCSWQFYVYLIFALIRKLFRRDSPVTIYSDLRRKAFQHFA